MVLKSTFKLSRKTDTKEEAPGHLGPGFGYGAGKQLANTSPGGLQPQREGGRISFHVTCATPGPLA